MAGVLNDVDRAAREIRLGDTKNGEGRVLAYDDELADLIEARWQQRKYRRTGSRRRPITDERTYLSEFVFHDGQGRQIGDFRKAWTTAGRTSVPPAFTNSS